MKALAYYIKLYFLIVAQYIKIRMQYRADFIISTIGMVALNITGFLTIWVIFKSIPDLAGWSYEELLFMYGFSLLALTPMQIFFDNIWSLWIHVLDGTFIKYYFRPLNMLFYFVSEVFDIKGLNQLIIAITIIVFASIKLAIKWTFVKVALFIALFFSSSLIMISLMILAASSAFWTLNSFAVLNLVFKFKDFSRYPLTIFNSFFKFLFTFIIPIGFIAYYPLQLFLKPDQASILIFFSPIAGILLFVLAGFVWKIGVESYTGTGS